MESEQSIFVQGQALPIGFCNKKELCNLFGDMSLFCLNKMIKPIAKQMGKPMGRRYHPKQICLLISTYGLEGIVYKTLFKQKNK